MTEVVIRAWWRQQLWRSATISHSITISVQGPARLTNPQAPIWCARPVREYQSLYVVPSQHPIGTDSTSETTACIWSIEPRELSAMRPWSRVPSGPDHT